MRRDQRSPLVGCSSQNLLASRAFAEPARLASTDKAIKADTIVFMATLRLSLGTMRQHRCCQSSMTRMIVLSHEPGCSRRDSFRNNSRVLQRMTPPPGRGCARLRRRMVARRLSVAGSRSAVTARQSARRKMTHFCRHGPVAMHHLLRVASFAALHLEDPKRAVSRCNLTPREASGRAMLKVRLRMRSPGYPGGSVPYSNACPIKPQPQVGSLK